MTGEIINVECVRNAINALKNEKSVGPDKVPTTLIKNVRDLNH